MIRLRCRTALLALAATLACCALTAASALASEKPFVETRPATGISETKATLNGVVNPHGAETKYHFDYGSSILYGKQTAEVSAGSGTTNLEVSKAIAELKPNAEYHFRLVATNINGTSNGADQVFLTTSIPGLPEFRVFPATFTVKSGNFSMYMGSGLKVTCTSSSGSGTITGAKTLTAKWTMTGCASGSTWCTSAGAAAGEVKTEELKSALVYTAKATKQVGIVLNQHELNFAKFECGGSGPGGIRKGAIAIVTPLNTPTMTYTVKLTQVAAKQQPAEYENEIGEKVGIVPQVNLIGSPTWENGALEASFEVKLSQLEEVKA
jgi:hypothetical protein